MCQSFPKELTIRRATCRARAHEHKRARFGTFQGKSMLAGCGAELPHKRHLMRSLIISMTCGQISLKCPSNARNTFYTSPPSCFDWEAQRAQKAVVEFHASPVLALYSYIVLSLKRGGLKYRLRQTQTDRVEWSRTTLDSRLVRIQSLVALDK